MRDEDLRSRLGLRGRSRGSEGDGGRAEGRRGDEGLDKGWSGERTALSLALHALLELINTLDEGGEGELGGG